MPLAENFDVFHSPVSKSKSEGKIQYPLQLQRKESPAALKRLNCGRGLTHVNRKRPVGLTRIEYCQ